METGRIVVILLCVLLGLAIGFLIVVIVFGNENNSVADAVQQGDGKITIKLPTDDTGQVGGIGELSEEIPPYVTAPAPTPPPAPSPPPEISNPCEVNGQNICEGTWKLHSPSGDDGVDIQNGDVVLYVSSAGGPYDSSFRVYNKANNGDGIPTPAFRFKPINYVGSLDNYLNMRNEETYTYTNKSKFKTIYFGAAYFGTSTPKIEHQQFNAYWDWNKLTIEGQGGNKAKFFCWDDSGERVAVIDWSKNSPEILDIRFSGGVPESHLIVEMTQVDTNSWPDDPTPPPEGSEPTGASCTYNLFEEQNHMAEQDDWKYAYIIPESEDTSPYNKNTLNIHLREGKYASIYTEEWNGNKTGIIDWSRDKCNASSVCFAFTYRKSGTWHIVDFVNSNAGKTTTVPEGYDFETFEKVSCP